MSEDASLDDFLGGESSEQSEADEEATGDDTEATVEAAESTAKTAADDTEATAETDTETAETDDVEPAATTYAWSGEGTTCEGCGETVERRWQQDGELVCIECKDWERA
ncbi:MULTISPECIES: DUF7573 domain-containing protein [Haloarcula]|uniref:DUF7573 domain-containing protein n=1 Tax=Haloarcula TaxID=2237 RepID=UPI0023E8A3AD|nr:hypothetical protein [Halomicroarcula sp. SHR3]